jgi:hypothetical protein
MKIKIKYLLLSRVKDPRDDSLITKIAEVLLFFVFVHMLCVCVCVCVSIILFLALNMTNNMQNSLIFRESRLPSVRNKQN